ncbi:alpha/beta hydrolase [Phaeovibrio sulfidiphilus]|uniref:Alpha/beta hydrolase n=1 Tax=Phaeovibrio sulfidiphilus TaxID=1220600 RepID=A0A8J7CQG6_9PROT|nr:alpha/beta hydrolase [Phaeovibrio sulfidiphilus]MBE1236810.1 alpha/beta hydrolase [Phaeovibrio sulfidiphilus]
MPEIIFNGAEGRLEGRYKHSSASDAPIALILSPHPQKGGTMNNKVVYTLFHTFASHGFSVMRFNFRGVGRSQGTFDNGPGELSDAASALDWMQSYNANARSCWVAGFSFGSWIAMQLLMRRPEINGFVSVAPPAGVHDFSFLAPCPSSGLIVHGSRDGMVAEANVARLAGKLSQQKNIKIDYRVVAGAGHTFSEHLPVLQDTVGAYLRESLTP